jgi:transcription antitermination protein NusB
MTRRNSRELALQVLFQKEFMATSDADELIQLFQKHLSLDGDVVGYTRDVVQGVLAKLPEIDEIIQRYSINWNIKRLSLVDLNILRIAVCEMVFLTEDSVPPKSVINEAIEIAKKYSSLEAPSFINGILDQILNKEIHNA